MPQSLRGPARAHSHAGSHCPLAGSGASHPPGHWSAQAGGGWAASPSSLGFLGLERPLGPSGVCAPHPGLESRKEAVQVFGRGNTVPTIAAKFLKLGLLAAVDKYLGLLFTEREAVWARCPARKVTWTRVLEAWRLDRDRRALLLQELLLLPPKSRRYLLGACLLTS